MHAADQPSPQSTRSLPAIDSFDAANRQGRTGRVASVNVAAVTQLTLRGQLHSTGINKVPSPGPVQVSAAGLEGDVQADRKVHGGEFKAVYAYTVEDYEWWSHRLGEELQPGTFGENLTLEGVPATEALIGERWSVGSAVLEVTQPREPCWKLGARMHDPQFPRRFREAGRPGVYFRVHSPGKMGPGDRISVDYAPPHPVSIGLISRLNGTNRELSHLLLRLCRLRLSAAEWQEVLHGDQVQIQI